MAHKPDGTQGRWALVSRDLVAGYGLFDTEADAWDFAVEHNLAERPFDRRKVDTVPLVRPAKIDVEAFERRLREHKPD